MKATIIADKEAQDEIFQHVYQQLLAFLNEKGLETELISIGRNDLAFCRGCFGCWIKKPGECVYNDIMSQINRSFINSDTVIYLSPVVFGQVSANIKTALDRWLPNILPFFETRPDGSTMHPSRYEAYPQLLFIGYGNEIIDEDAQLFKDILKKHRKHVEVLIYQGNDRDIADALPEIEFRMVGGQL